MKAMKIVVSTFVVLFSAIVVVAQPPKREKIDPAERADRMTKHMTEQLALSDEQADQIRQILTDNFTQMEADRPQKPEMQGDQKMDRPKRVPMDSTKVDSLRKAQVERMTKNVVIWLPTEDGDADKCCISSFLSSYRSDPNREVRICRIKRIFAENRENSLYA